VAVTTIRSSRVLCSEKRICRTTLFLL
jgi:hypothetical protein